MNFLILGDGNSGSGRRFRYRASSFEIEAMLPVGQLDDLPRVADRCGDKELVITVFVETRITNIRISFGIYDEGSAVQQSAFLPAPSILSGKKVDC